METVWFNCSEATPNTMENIKHARKLGVGNFKNFPRVVDLTVRTGHSRSDVLVLAGRWVNRTAGVVEVRRPPIPRQMLCADRLRARTSSGFVSVAREPWSSCSSQEFVFSIESKVESGEIAVRGFWAQEWQGVLAHIEVARRVRFATNTLQDTLS